MLLYMSRKTHTEKNRKLGFHQWVADFKFDEATTTVTASKTTAANFSIFYKKFENHHVDSVEDSTEDYRDTIIFNSLIHQI